MLSTDPHDIKASFLEILQDKNAKIRKVKTLELFKRIDTRQVAMDPAITLSLVEACRCGDIKIVKLYLEHKANSSPERHLECPRVCKKRKPQKR